MVMTMAGRMPVTILTMQAIRIILEPTEPTIPRTRTMQAGTVMLMAMATMNRNKECGCRFSCPR